LSKEFFHAFENSIFSSTTSLMEINKLKMDNMNPSLDFKFQPELKSNLNLELPFTEHVEELRQRSFHVLGILILVSCIAFIDIKPIVQLLEVPVQNVKFFQLSPGEYFISTVKIAFYTGILLTSPFLLSQLTFFVIPGLNSGEKKLILPLLIGSTVLFFISLGFSYFVLIPAALQFFISYSSDVIEPLWSFNQYFDFILVLFYTTGLASNSYISNYIRDIGRCIRQKYAKTMEICYISRNNYWCDFNTINGSNNSNIIIRCHCSTLCFWCRSFSNFKSLKHYNICTRVLIML